MYLSKVEQMSYWWNKYSIRLVPWNKYYSIIFFLLEQILLGTNIRSQGRYCACEILIANPIDWLYAVCLEYFIFFAIDSSGARKQYDELSVNHANNNLCT